MWTQAQATPQQLVPASDTRRPDPIPVNDTSFSRIGDVLLVAHSLIATPLMFFHAVPLFGWVLGSTFVS